MKAKPRPARQVCPICGWDDALAITVAGPALWKYECTNSKHAPVVWFGTATDRLEFSAGENIMKDLGLFDLLPECLVTGEPFAEYGVVEYRFSQRNPDVFGEIVDLYSHTRLGPTQYSASAFLAKALGMLADRGVILYRWGRATGYWSYNGSISYWRLPGGSISDDVITYESFAESVGIDPRA